MLKLIAPAGIGDISWVYSKLTTLDRRVGLAYADWPPRRSQPLVRLLPNVEDLGYVSWPNYPKRSISYETDLSTLNDGEYYIQCNIGLEEGRRIETMFPHQQTDYHYRLNIPALSTIEGRTIIDSIDGSHRIGLYASAYYSENYWSLQQWYEFIAKVRDEFPDAAFYIVGTTWDNLTYDLYKRLRLENWNVASCCGAQDLGVTLSLIAELDYFFAYPSGLGIMADVLNVPSMMWYWAMHGDSFLNTYADPVNVASGKHINILSGPVEESFNHFMEKGAQFLA